MNTTYHYIIVGGGTAAASAVEGIREVDRERPALLIAAERHLPYDRPPLSKKLWFGKKQIKDIFLHDREYYEQNGVSLVLGTKAIGVDAARKTVTDDTGKEYGYNKLLIASGGVPRMLPIEGGDLPGIYYYRYLDDYQNLHGEAISGATATVIGGGFIGSELAAALTIKKVRVTMIFPEPYVCYRVFPRGLGCAVQRRFQDRGIIVEAEDIPVSISREDGQFVIQTDKEKRIRSDILLAGIGISPSITLAQRAGLETGNGIVVNTNLQTSNPDIYAAGDNALFPYETLGKQMRVEHWDNARAQGKQAGRNMAGAREAFSYMPYFFSDLFEFGYEAVGDINPELDIITDWQKENDTGIVYYLKDHMVRGAMMCNVWERLDAAREMIRSGRTVTEEELQRALV